MTNTYDTSNEPLGSTAVKVLYNNASNLDEAVNSDAETWVDRPPFGRVRRTWRGMENAFDQFLLNSGYQFIGDYDADGPLTITAANQIFSKDGEYWRASPTLALPYTTVNNWVVDQPKFVSTGDASLRQELALPGGAGMLGFDSGTAYPAGSIGYAAGPVIKAMKWPDQFPDLTTWAASGGSLGISEGVYPLTSQLTFPFGTVLHTYGDVVLDASAATALGNFPNSCTVRLGGGSFSPLPALSINYLKGANLLTFTGPHGLNVGDVFVIYNPTDFSYSSFRSYYRAGEFCRVMAVLSSTQVRLAQPLYAAYNAASVNIYKMNGGSFNLKGSLKVIGPETLPSVMGVRAQRLIDSDITGLQAYSKQSSSALELEKCFNVDGRSLLCEQGLLSGTGNDYGLIISNSQHIRAEGYFVASRHAVTTGGYGDVGSVPCRDITVRGTATTTFEGQAHAVDTHGNTEYFTFAGDIYGGFDGGGNHLTVKGRVFTADDGIAFYHAEMTGYHRDYTNVRVYAETNPAVISRGVIDLGGNNTSSAAADTLGGVFDCSGMVVTAPAAMSIFKLIQRNSTATNIRVKLTGAQVAQAAVGYEALRVADSGAAAFARLSLEGFEAPGEGARTISVFEVTGMDVGGFVDIAVTTGVASANAVVTLPAGWFKDAPIVLVNTNTTSLGSTSVSANTNTPTVSAFTITVKTGSLANFGAAGTIRVFWKASTLR